MSYFHDPITKMGLDPADGAYVLICGPSGEVVQSDEPLRVAEVAAAYSKHSKTDKVLELIESFNLPNRRI
jgi:hypothetical protein